MQLRQLARSSTLRFAALVFALQLGSSMLILLAVHQRLGSELQRIAQDEAENLRDDMTAAFNSGGEPAAVALARVRVGGTGSKDAVILLTDPHGNPVAGNIGALPPTLPPDGQWHRITLYRVDSDTPDRMIASVTQFPGGERMLAGHVVEDNLQLRAIVEEAMLGVLLLSLPLALLGALLATRLVSRRISGIAQTVDEVAAGNLSHRIPPDGSGDTFERLAAGINAMLDRIEALVTELRIVTDGLAHDLRSPLSRMRTAIDRAMTETHDDRALAALGAVSGEADSLLAMLDTALRISRAEAGIGRDRFTRFDLAEMVEDIGELYAPVAEDRGFALAAAAPGPIEISAHRELLGQAIANLIDNALKYARPGPILLAAGAEGEWAAISVTDAGPGIAEDRRAEALRRFGRLDPARHVAGAGLGLSLLVAVAHLHGGEVGMEGGEGGFTVRLRLPRRA